MKFVIDCSFSSTLFLSDENSKIARDFLGTPEEFTQIFIPSLWWCETASVINMAIKRNRIKNNDIQDIVDSLKSLRFETDICLGLEHLNSVLTLADKYKISVYDAVYVELAIRKKAELMTFDKDLSQNKETNNMLKIKNLHASNNEKEILKGLNLTIKAGEVHAIMGKNGSGKTTLANILAGNSSYKISSGSILFEGNDLTKLKVDERAKLGIFLAMQYPVEIPGINNMYFLRTSVNSIRKAKNLPELDAFDFMNLVKEYAKKIKLDEKFLHRDLNIGFSGGEKKHNEILQMMLLEPKLAILDEIDSGLDIDALSSIAKAVNLMRSNDRSIIMITHYERLLTYVVPDFIHIMINGKIVQSGGKELALELEKKGYVDFDEGIL